MKDRGGIAPWLFLAVAVTAFMIGMADASASLGDAAPAVWIAAIVGGVFVLRGPIGQALARRLGGEGQPGATAVEPPSELLAELEQLRHRVYELEERAEFTDRLLTRARDEQPLTTPLPGA